MINQRTAPEEGKDGTSEYDLLALPQIRRRLLRDAYADRAGGASKSHSKRMVDGLLRLKPLTSLTGEEYELLRLYLIEHFSQAQEMLYEKTNFLRPIDRPEGLVGRLSRHELWAREFDFERIPGRVEKATMGVWSSKDRLSEGIDAWFWKAMDKRVEEGQRPVDFLEIGAAECQFAEKVKRRYGAGVIVHASSLESQPHKDVDRFHLLCTEFMPETFNAGFDVVVANWAAEFAVFPHIFISNAVKCLREGGEAAITLNTHRLAGVDLILDKRLERKVRDYYGRQGLFERLTRQLEAVNEETPIEVMIDQHQFKETAPMKDGVTDQPEKDYEVYVFVKRREKTSK